MANIVDVAPTVGFGAVWTQTGPASGYGAIDDRRAESVGRREGLLSDGSYLVTQRAAGANGTVDVAANVGDGFVIQGDSIPSQGSYVIPPSSTVINVDIAAGDLTNPRNDLVVLEVKDDAVDASGLNKARVRVIQGTPNAAAALTDALGVNGTPTLPGSAVPLAVVRQPANGVAVTNAMIDDRRYRTSGYVGIAAAETTSSTTYTLLATPDRVRNVVVPANAFLNVAYRAAWQSSVGGAGRTAFFVGSNQLKQANTATPGVLEWSNLTTASDQEWPTGPGTYVGDVTTGQTIPYSAGLSIQRIFVDPGVYDISVRYRGTSGTVTAKQRRLWVWLDTFPA